MTLPTFLVIGAMKAGTTSLHRYLGAHPDVFVSSTKQLDFFVDEHEWRRGVEWYEAQFAAADGALATGEASPRYSMDPIFGGVPERAAGVVPDVKVVYALRHPIERIRSHHRHALAEWSDPVPLADALERSRFDYLTPSRYGHQLGRWLSVIPRDRVHVVTTEDLASDPAATVAHLFEFLGVGAAPIPEAVRHNRSGTQRRAPGAVQRLRASGVYRGFRHRVPQPARRLAYRLASRPHPVDDDLATLPPELELDILAELRPDLEHLRDLLGGFHCWGLLDAPRSAR